MKTSNHTIRCYANGIITLEQAKEKINMALCSIVLGRGFGESFEDYLNNNPKTKKWNDHLEQLQIFLYTNPTQLQAKEILI